MKKFSKEKKEALKVLDRVKGRSILSEKEIEAFAIKPGKKITGRR